MNCRRAQEMILTDYLDERMTSPDDEALKNHLANCPRCRQFEQTAKKTTVDPFANVFPQEPDDKVWKLIQAEISGQTEKSVKNPLEQFFNSVQKALFPNVRAGLIPGVCLLLLAIVLIKGILGLGLHFNTVNKEGREDVEYIASVIEYPQDVWDEDEEGYGTDLESVFLQT